MLASYRDNLEVVKVLVAAAGIDVNATDKVGVWAKSYEHMMCGMMWVKGDIAFASGGRS